ncbi:MAG: OmpA family protein [Burkholderiaceae bacterium]
MSLLADTPAPERAEIRTQAGWQRFDRAAGTGALALLALWLLTWILGATLRDDPRQEPQAPAIAAAGAGRSDPAVPAKPAAAPEARASGVASDAGDVVSRPSGRGSAKPEAGPRAATDGKPRAATDGKPRAATDGKPRAEGKANTESRPGADAARATPGASTSAARNGALPPFAERMPDAGPGATPRPLPVPGAKGTPGAAADSSSGASADAGQAQRSDAARVDRIDTRSGVPISPAITRDAEAAPAQSLLEPILDLRASEGRLQIDGILGDEDTRRALVRSALKIYGMRNLTDRLAVSPGVASFDWSDQIEDLMVLLDGPEAEIRVRVNGQMVMLVGTVASADDKTAKGLQAQQLFGTTAIIDNRLQVSQDSARMISRPDSAATGAATEAAPKLALGEAPASADLGRPEAAAPAASAGQAKPAESATPPVATGTDEPAPAPSTRTDDTPEPGVPPDAEGGRQAAAGEIRARSRGAPDNFKPSECARVVTGVYVTFDSASARLDPTAREILDDILDCLPRRNYVIGGHTDNRGDGASNRTLSQMRADAVKNYLIEKGANPADLTAIGHGETKPVATNNNKAGRARNRRVDFRLEG